ncbi:MAG: DUF4837 family protein [Longimicrobiales bacterium]
MKSAGLAALVVVAGCNAIDRTEPAHGEVTSLIVVAADTLWASVGDGITSALEARIFTVRNEKAFDVTHVSPQSEDWLELRQFRRVVVIGASGDGWMVPVLGDSGLSALPAVVERRDVWARGQTVTALVVPPEGSAAAVAASVASLAERLDSRFREWVRSRMFLSGRNTELRDSLASMAGFSLLLPNLYRPDVDGNLYVFRSSNDVGGRLARVIAVTWRGGLESLTPDAALAWRDSVAQRVFAATPGQGIDRTQVHDRPLTDAAEGSFEVQGIWESRDRTLPAAGPFVDRIVLCPDQDRTYFLEAWLFAPGRQKYEYMIQFETLLNAFECGGAAR